MDISGRPSLPIVAHFRLSSHKKQNQGTPSKETPSRLKIGKENAPSAKSSRSPSTRRQVHEEKIFRATKQRALSSPHPLSAINQNIQRIPISMSSMSSIHSKRIPARRRKAASSNPMPSTTSRTQSSLQSTSTLLSTTPFELTTPIPEARVIHLPYAHSLLKQRNKCVMSPKAPHSCLARTKANTAFSPNERHLPRRSSAYPRLEDTSDDTFHSYSYTESSTRSPSPDAIEAQLIGSHKMGLYSAVHVAPEWLVTEATKNKVLPGAVPTTDYHEDIVPSTPTKVYQPQWFRRLKGILFGW